jgi:hypothetical protein
METIVAPDNYGISVRGRCPRRSLEEVSEEGARNNSPGAPSFALFAKGGMPPLSPRSRYLTIQASKIRFLSGHDFTGCEKARIFEGYGR